jgi:small conductance mechanosensitive channel
MTMAEVWASIREFAEEYLWPMGLHLLLALIVFVIGRWVARAILRALDRVMERSHLDVSLRKFLGDVIYAVLFVVVIVVALDMVGLKTTAVVAVLGAAGLAVGLALQGSLSNFAAGVMLIVLRPYKVTDLVQIGKYLGRVDAIKVFNTVLVTPDNKQITIPNGQVIAAPIENLTVLGRRRVDLVVNVLQVADVAKVKELLTAALIADSRIHPDPGATVEVVELGDQSAKLWLRPWTDTDLYSTVASDAMGRVRDALVGAGLKFTITLQSLVPTVIAAA